VDSILHLAHYTTSRFVLLRVQVNLHIKFWRRCRGTVVFVLVDIVFKINFIFLLVFIFLHCLYYSYFILCFSLFSLIYRLIFSLLFSFLFQFLDTSGADSAVERSACGRTHYSLFQDVRASACEHLAHLRASTLHSCVRALRTAACEHGPMTETQCTFAVKRT
jgi:hypothetical protein